VIVVEHDEDTMRAADYLIDMGPKAGEGGGRIVACGTPEEVESNTQSLTGAYLSGRRFIDVPKHRHTPIEIYGTKGSLRWDLQQPNEMILGRRDEPNQILQRSTPGFDVDIAGFSDYPGGHPEGFADAHKMHYRAVYEHIAGGRRTPLLFASAEDGHQEVKLCEAVLKSSRSKGWVKV